MARRWDRSIKEGLWSAAMCVEARGGAALIRDSLEELGYEYTRDMSHKPFTKFMVVIPWPKFAYVFQFKVTRPAEFIVNIYDVQPTSAGGVHMMEVAGITPRSIKPVVRLMRRFRRNLRRPPWDFHRGERLQTGYLLGEFTAARGRWRSVGVV